MIIVLSDLGETRCRRMNVHPPLADEAHTCKACRLRYALVTVEQAFGVIRRQPAAVQEKVRSVPAQARGVHPESALVGRGVRLSSARCLRRLHHPAASGANRGPARVGTEV
jgi:hypothetical protein